ncbi:MAG: hypothetical protein ABI358_09300 [Ginsengibacter sp.]
MMSKITSLYIKKKEHRLSKLMIVALLEAYLKQHQNVPFGPVDINGSFNSLYNRNLIVRKPVVVQGNTETWWQVTPEAINILKNLGVDLPDNS